VRHKEWANLAISTGKIRGKTRIAEKAGEAAKVVTRRGGMVAESPETTLQGKKGQKRLRRKLSALA